jgi:hypothetical protein
VVAAKRLKRRGICAANKQFSMIYGYFEPDSFFIERDKIDRELEELS